MDEWNAALKSHKNCYRAAKDCCGQKLAKDAYYYGHLFPKAEGLLSNKCCNSCSFFDALPRCKSVVETGVQVDTMDPLIDCKRHAHNGECTKDPKRKTGFAARVRR